MKYFKQIGVLRMLSAIITIAIVLGLSWVVSDILAISQESDEKALANNYCGLDVDIDDNYCFVRNSDEIMGIVAVDLAHFSPLNGTCIDRNHQFFIFDSHDLSIATTYQPQEIHRHDRTIATDSIMSNPVIYPTIATESTDTVKTFRVIPAIIMHLIGPW